jgi:putative hydrolase of the HAD superfamily
MSRYRHLFFDLDNTIWDFNLNSYHALKETFILYGLDLHLFDRFFEIYIFHNEKLWELYRQNRITKEILSRERFRLSFAETGITGVDGTGFNRDYLTRLPDQTRLCDGAGNVLEKLSGKYEMYIITNGFSEVQYAKLENSGISRFFSKVFVSEEIGYAKPSPEIFRFAMKHCNARKRESLMIGDSWEVDIAGAMETGIDQVYYQPYEDSVLPENGEKSGKKNSKTTTYLIKHLEELVNILL